MGVKDALAEKADSKGSIKLTKSMSIADMIKAMEPEIKKALHPYCRKVFWIRVCKIYQESIKISRG